MVVADAMPYAKLLDCTTMVTQVTDDEMMRLKTVDQARDWLKTQQY